MALTASGREFGRVEFDKKTGDLEGPRCLVGIKKKGTGSFACPFEFPTLFC
jgi:hypothetical protein